MPALRRLMSVALAAGIASTMPVAGVTSQVAAAHKKHHTKEAAPKNPASTPTHSPATSGKTTAQPTDEAADKTKPKSDAEAKPDSTAEAPDVWSESEIKDAKAACAEILKRVDAVVIAREPIREGACGAAAPVEVLKIGRNPEVTLSPPAIIRCDLMDALATWLDKDVQPLARKHFKSEIVEITTMSSYACRNAYRRKTTRLSEHGLANALDIGDFITASAKTASVLGAWGETERDQAARIAAETAAKVAAAAAAEAAAAEIAKAATVAHAGHANANSNAQPAHLRATIPEGLPTKTIESESAPQHISARQTTDTTPEQIDGPETRRNGAKPKMRAKKRPLAFTPVKGNASSDPETQAFLKEAHQSACRIFGTTLGPEANRDHLNHFHVDMAPRKFKKICD